MASYIGPPPGTIFQFAGSASPTGYLMCDGSAVSRTTYADLFSAIGVAYGTGNGTTTFNLPDGRGRGLVGLGTHVEVATLGSNEGVSVSSRRPKHKHVIGDPGHTHTYTNPGGNLGSGASGGVSGPNAPGTPTGSATTGITVGPQSGSEPTDSAAFLVVNHIIKY